jgi:salicylate hydroxylase
VCVAEKDAWTEESWTKSGDKKALNSAFASWHPIIEELIQEAHEEELYEWGLFDRPAMSTWFEGRTTLIGDACHPMLPFLAQGAAMAIEDAFILAEMIAMQTHRLEKTFEIFFHERIKRVSKVQNASRRNATVFHLSGISTLVRNILAPTQGQRISDYLYKFNAIDKYSAKPMIIEKGD